MDLIDRLLEHDRWATTVLLESAQDLDDAALDREFDIGHRTLRETLDHQVLNIELWTATFGGQPFQPDALTADRSVPGFLRRHARAYDHFASRARELRDTGQLDDLFNDHFGEPQRYGAVVVHVVLHNEGHRTEILHFLNRLGVKEVPEVDHALWDHVDRGAFRGPETS